MRPDTIRSLAIYKWTYERLRQAGPLPPTIHEPRPPFGFGVALTWEDDFWSMAIGDLRMQLIMAAREKL